MTAGRDRRYVALLPGLVVLAAGAAVADALAPLIGVNALFLAILLGALLANAVGVPGVARAGVETHDRFLVAGIVLMGALVSVGTVREVGPSVLVVIVGAAAFSLLTVELLAKNVFGLADRLGSLLAAGASICGVSAVAGVAGAISARERDVAYASATILLFDAITLVVYPIVGEALELSGPVFGIWAGVSMFSTGPVVAVGFAHSELAGQWATMTKLARNALIGIVILVYAAYYAGQSGDGSSTIGTVREGFPTFVLGFLALVAVASTGVFTADQEALIETAYGWLFLVAFVGLGTEIRPSALRDAGVVPIAVVCLAFLATSVLSLAVLLAIL